MMQDMLVVMIQNVSCAVNNSVTTLSVQSAMVTAYNDARGRTNPTATELGGGNIGGMTLAPGIYNGYWHYNTNRCHSLRKLNRCMDIPDIINPHY